MTWFSEPSLSLQTVLDLSQISFQEVLACHPPGPGPVPGSGDAVPSKTGLCCQGTPGDLFSVANHINKLILTHQWVFVYFPLGITYVCFTDLVIQRSACGGVLGSATGPEGRYLSACEPKHTLSCILAFLLVSTSLLRTGVIAVISHYIINYGIVVGT